MCFGDKKADNGPGVGPRPASTLPQKHSQPYGQDGTSNGKSSYNGYSAQNTSAGGPSGDYAPPSGPPPQQYQQPAQDYAAPSGPPPSHNYAPPSGPPPSHVADYAPPPGPPPSSGPGDYAPPTGPPPGHGAGGSNDDWIAPPSGPPPGQQKVHDWETAVPDTSLFPPPPALFNGWDRSPANNATEQEANAGEAWVAQYPLCQPLMLDPPARSALERHDITLMQPTGFRGTMTRKTPGVWEVKTQAVAPDSSIIGYPPLYAVQALSPLATGRPVTVYYEVRVRDDSRREETSLALGFAALPYPNFRLPGWHRGSLAVHGDDGHKYINDRWGGQTFTQPFKRGETLGLGMTFSTPGAMGRPLKVEVFFTRDGRVAGSWDLHEEGDAQVDLPVTGLEGFHDLSCAVGTFNRVSIEIVFDPARWKYRPANA